jgi:glycosyltransferase 2 family protein
MFSTTARKAARAIVAIALMWWATRNVAWGEVFQLIASGSWRWFAMCLALVVFDRILMAWRSITLLRAVESTPRVPLTRLIRLFFVSTFVGTFLPGGIGGDAVRAVSLTRLGVSTSAAVGSVAVDRLLGTVSVLLMAVFGALLAGQQLDARLLRLALLVTAIGVSGAMLLLFDSRVLEGLVRTAGGGRMPTIERWAQKFLSAVRQYGTHHGVLVAILAASVAVQALRSAQAWCLGLALGLAVGGLWYFALIPFVVLAFLLPLSISGLGAGTASFVWLFVHAAGATDADATALALLFWFLGVLGNLPGGLLMLVAPGDEASLKRSKT